MDRGKKGPKRKVGQSGSEFVVVPPPASEDNFSSLENGERGGGGGGVKFKESETQAKLQLRLINLRFGSYGLLGLVMAVTWVTAFAAVFSDSRTSASAPASFTSRNLWYPFVIFHGLQVSIFTREGIIS